MENSHEQLEALKDIRQMMKQSNRFLSLSGLSGIFAGVYALIGVYFGADMIEQYLNSPLNGTYGQYGDSRLDEWILVRRIVLTSIAVLGMSLITAWFFSSRKAKKQGSKLFDHTTLRLFLNMAIPLGAGGLFCLALLMNGVRMAGLLSPVMLIFYGMALVNGSKYTLHEIRYLGCLEILLGIAASFFMDLGLIFWAIGFGALHIIYGAYMWNKYDRRS